MKKTNATIFGILGMFRRISRGVKTNADIRIEPLLICGEPSDRFTVSITVPIWEGREKRIYSMYFDSPSIYEMQSGRAISDEEWVDYIIREFNRCYDEQPKRMKGGS